MIVEYIVKDTWKCRYYANNLLGNQWESTLGYAERFPTKQLAIDFIKQCDRGLYTIVETYLVP